MARVASHSTIWRADRARRSCIAVVLLLAVAITIAALPQARADDKKPDEKPPKILFVSPLGIAPGAAARLVIQGLNFEEATAVEATWAGGPVETKILDKKKARVPGEQKVEDFGDSQVEIELTLPADKSGDALSLAVVAPGGKTETYQLPVGPADSLIAEKEPNDGFGECQNVVPGKTILGSIHEGRNVDVYCLEGHAGDVVTFAVAARAHGSRLDALLWLHDARGTLLASSDDHGGSVDAHLQYKLPSDGKYWLTLMDANDLGGPAYPYRLTITAGK